ncbi:hypothetical protein EC915_11637 [Pseudomonas sp. LP_7_YM]|nr:hypothetical protein EC915_11637 [Pseudomonas sp. LP_7_YM]
MKKLDNWTEPLMLGWPFRLQGSDEPRIDRFHSAV